jgi:hypothetical protein
MGILHLSLRRCKIPAAIERRQKIIKLSSSVLRTASPVEG